MSRAPPNVDPDVRLTANEEQRLYRHYGMGTAQRQEESERAGEPGAVAPDSSAETGAVAAAAGGGDSRPEPEPALTADSSAHGSSQEPTADDAMTRSEEEVHIDKRTRESGRAHLKKYVVTDYVQTKVPVKREEVRLEREPPNKTDQG
jgi:stress response protein YsnF